MPCHVKYRLGLLQSPYVPFRSLFLGAALDFKLCIGVAPFIYFERHYYLSSRAAGPPAAPLFSSSFPDARPPASLQPGEFQETYTTLRLTYGHRINFDHGEWRKGKRESERVKETV